MFNNINGYLSKVESLEKIVKSVDPDIIALCETKKASRIKKEELKQYNVLESNLKGGKEGLLIGVKNGTFKSIREVTDTELKNIMSVRIQYPLINLRVIVTHAPQETDEEEVRSEFFEEVAVQIERAITSGDKVLLLGDFNARITPGLVNKVVAEKGSPNGKDLSSVIAAYNLKVANFHDQAEGWWSRIQSDKNGNVHKSLLDYLIVQEDMFQSLESMVVDEDKMFCPYRLKSEKGEKKIVYSDHCTIIAELKTETGKVQHNKDNRIKTWNFSSDGYEKYQVASQESMKLKENNSESTTAAYGEWEVGLEKLLSNCFRKVTRKMGAETDDGSKASKEVRQILAEFKKKGKIQREIIAVYFAKLVMIESSHIAEVRAQRVKSTMADLTENEKFSPTGYWKVKKAVKKGIRKDNGITNVMKENGIEIDGEEAIKDAYKEEFEIRLSNRKPAAGWEEYVEETNTVVREWLKGDCSSTPQFTLKELKKIVAKLKSGKSPGLDGYPAELFKYAGDGVLKSLLEVYNMIKKSREIPKQWDLVKIVTIYKQKGSKKVLKYYRGIFLTLVVSKIFEQMVKERIENNLSQVNLLQAGSRRERGAPDNVFLFRACIDHHKFTKRPLFVTAYDFEQAFDSLWLEDCILSLEKLGIEKEYLQIIYNMNKQAVVTVQTPFGVTSKFVTDPIVKQGTVLGPVLCSSSTGEYSEENVGVCMGTINIPSLLYVDDIIDLTSSMEDCIEAHKNAILFGRKKKIKYSGTKCYCMVLNTNGDLPCLEIDEENNVVPSEEIIYLGDVFNMWGNNEGLVEDRVRRGMKAMLTITSLMAETNVGVHHVSTMLLLYRSLFLSTMLFNSQTWSKIRQKQMDKLRTQQLKFLKRIIGVGSYTSNAFIFLELGVLPIEFEIDKRKLMYLHRILNLEDTDPVYVTFLNMMSFHKAGEENWWSGVEEALERYKLPSDLNKIKEMGKDVFRDMVNKAVTKLAFEKLVLECHSQKKTATLTYNSFCVQDYLLKMFPHQSRVIFKCRSEIVDIKTHFTHKYKDSVCRGCRIEDEELSHIVNCGQEAKVDMMDITNLDDLDYQALVNLKLLASRVTSFVER